MGFFEKLTKSKGGYIFLSHSHDDIEKVRLIRNNLEQEGFEPLCFYLKCLNDDSEIEDLIKREIDAREWFVYADSENAKNSKWVQLEREYIERTNSKKIITVDINDPDAVSKATETISRNLRVFLSHSHKDSGLALRIKEKLEKKDYLVFDLDSIPAGSESAEVAANAIVEASKEGCVIALLTPNTLQSVWVKREIMYAIQQGGNLILILVGDVKPTVGFQMAFADKPQYHLSENPTDGDLDNIIHRIGCTIVGK